MRSFPPIKQIAIFSAVLLVFVALVFFFSKDEGSILTNEAKVEGEVIVEDNILLEDSEATIVGSLVPGYPLITRTWNEGDVGEEIALIKKKFIYILQGQATNVFDDNLKEFITLLQTQYKLPVTGAIDEATKDAINETVFYDYYRSLGEEELKGTPEWNRLEDLEKQISASVDTLDCKQIEAGGDMNCSLKVTLNTQDHHYFLRSIDLHFSGSNVSGKILNVAVYFRSDTGGLSALSERFIPDQNGNVHLDFIEEGELMYPGRSYTLEVMVGSLIDLTGTLTTTLTGYETLFKKYSLTQPLSNTMSVIPHDDVGEFWFSAFNNTTEVSIGSNLPLQRVGMFRFNNNLVAQSVSPYKFYFRVDSPNNASYESLFENITLTAFGRDLPQSVSVQKTSSTTFVITALDPFTFASGGTDAFSLKVDSLSPGTEFQVHLTNVETKEGISPTGFPIAGYYVTVIQ